MAETAQRPSFDEFYSSAAARLVRHSYALTGDMAEAQDIAQEAFARAWQRWSAVRECDSPEAWVRRVATNLAASRWRRIRVARAAAGQPAPQHAPEVSTDTVALVCGLRTLPERQRTVLVLHYMCDLSVDQIAAELGCPAGSVKSWLSRGRTALAEAVRVVEPDGLGSTDAAATPAATAPPATVGVGRHWHFVRPGCRPRRASRGGRASRGNRPSRARPPWSRKLPWSSQPPWSTNPRQSKERCRPTMTPVASAPVHPTGSRRRNGFGRIS